MQDRTTADADAQDSRHAYYARIATRHMTPLWEVLGALVPPSPRPDAVPAIWRYAEVRDQVMEAGRLITAEEAERRVLILENPALRGQSCITPSLYAGLQLIMPGEVAPAIATRSRRCASCSTAKARTRPSTASARRCAAATSSSRRRGPGTITATPATSRSSGSMVSTSRWCASSTRASPRRATNDRRPSDVRKATRWHATGRNMLPMDFHQTPGEATRLFVYPYAQTRASLEGIAGGTPDAHVGFKLRYVNPATGASPIPTIGAYAQRLPQGFETRPYRCTDGTVYVCLEGDGEADIGGTTYRFDERDVFVVPSWHALRLTAGRTATLFSFSDRPVQQALGLWREQRL